MRKNYKTISVPEELIDQVEKLISETGFRTPTEFILYYVRRAIAKIQSRKEEIEKIVGDLSPKEAKVLKNKLKELGYFD